MLEIIRKFIQQKINETMYKFLTKEIPLKRPIENLNYQQDEEELKEGEELDEYG